MAEEGTLRVGPDGWVEEYKDGKWVGLGWLTPNELGPLGTIGSGGKEFTGVLVPYIQRQLAAKAPAAPEVAGAAGVPGVPGVTGAAPEEPIEPFVPLGGDILGWPPKPLIKGEGGQHLPELASLAGLSPEATMGLLQYGFGLTIREFVSEHKNDRTAMAAALDQIKNTEEGAVAILKGFEDERIGYPPESEASDYEKSLLESLTRDQETPDFRLGGGDGGGGAGGAGGYGGGLPSGYYDLVRAMQAPETFGGAGYWNWLKAMLPPGGPGTAGEFYTGMSRGASPLTYEGDWAEFMGRGAFPSTYLPSTAYSALGKAVLPQYLSMPGEFWGMMEGMWPDVVAPGTEADFSMMNALGAPGNEALGAFLVSLMQGDPELSLRMMEAAQSMQQEAFLPFLSLFMGPAGQTAPEEAQ